MSSSGTPLPTSSSSSVSKNVTVDDNAISLRYSQGWDRSVSSSAFGGSFQSSSNVGDVVSFSLPANAVAVYYFGFKQSSGALYEACLDCPTDMDGKLDVIDGHSNGTDSSEPTILYERTNLDPNVRHTLALINVPDTRFGNHSTITVDSFVVTLQDDGTLSSSSMSSATSSSSSGSSVSATSSMAAASLMAMNPVDNSGDDSPTQTAPPVPQDTSSAATSAASASASDLGHAQDQSNLSAGQRAAQNLRSPLAITGVILGVLFVVCTALYALMYFMRRRKRRRTAPGMAEGHWATRFFGEKGRGSIWLGRGHGGRSEAGTGGGDVKIAKGAMIEQLVPDRPTYASLPSHRRPPPMSTMQYQPREPQWAPPLSQPLTAPLPAGPPRTIPRSAFPPATAGPYGDRPTQDQQLARSRSMSPNPMYAQPQMMIPNPGPAPPPARNPSVSAQYQQELYQQGGNPYVEEARARVRDRARAVPNGDWTGPGQVNGYGSHGPLPPIPGYGMPGPGPGYGAPGVQRNGSFGSRYSQ